MSEYKHDLTPWHVAGESTGGRYIIVKSASGRTVARVPFSPASAVHTNSCTDHHDAMLIAAAPDLLAALQSLVNQYGGTTSVASDSPRATAARAAIAKAEGRAE